VTAALVPVGLVVLLAVLAMCALAAWNLRLFRVAPPPLADPPSLSILMPARNEVDQIEGAVRASCADLPPGREVVVLDDGSTDGTGAVLARLARKLPGLRVVTGAPLPPGWAGKAWACWQLASEHARGEWLLFVDCDVRLARHAPARLLAAARAESVAFASAFPRQHVLTVGEALLVPLVHLVLLAYLPMALLRRVPRASLSAGCGQLMLARREVYLAADGHRAIRATLHDGIQLARRMKAAGHAIAVLDGRDLATCRMYVGLSGAWRGFARNAYEALGSPAALAVMCLLNAGLFIAPWLGLGAALATTGWSEAAAVWALAVAAVVALRARLARRFGAPLWTALATPVAVTLMIALQIHSYFTHCTGRPVVWRARAYPGAAPVRKGRA
jgi:glycosyltransferase involved in cell wall biosynthesis